MVFLLGFKKPIYGKSMETLWCFYDISIGISQGMSMVILWDSYGFSKECLWDFYDVSMGFLWASYGVSMIVL